MNRRLAALAIAATALLGLTACTGAPAGNGASPAASANSTSSGSTDAGSGQTVRQACDLVQATIEESAADLGDISTEDPSRAAEIMQTAAAAVAELPGKVSNTEIAALLPDFTSAFQSLADALSAVAEGDLSQATQLESIGTSVQESIQKFSELCAG